MRAPYTGCTPRLVGLAELFSSPRRFPLADECSSIGFISNRRCSYCGCEGPPASAALAGPAPLGWQRRRRVGRPGRQQFHDRHAEHAREEHERLDRDVLAAALDPADPLHGGVDLLSELFLGPTTRTPQLGNPPADERLDLARILAGQPREGRTPEGAVPSTYGLKLIQRSVLLRSRWTSSKSRRTAANPPWAL